MTIALAAPPEAREGPVRIGAYRLLDRIGAGGMGMVHRAFDAATFQMVALKTPRGGTPAETAGLLREAALLKQLHHPGIVRFIADGRWNGMPWIAMELLEGRTLLDELESIWIEAPSTRDWLGPRGTPREETPTTPGRFGATHPFAPRAPGKERPAAAEGRLGEVAEVVGRLAAALDHLHAQGLVHRDVKPANVVVQRAAERIARVTLLDFGVACQANRARAAHGDNLCVGTMQYAAPEQIVGDPVDARTDVYSLGCILYEIVTGLRPFEGESNHDVAQKHLYREAAAPSTLVSDVPWQLEDLVMEMLAKKPGERPRSAGAAGARLALIAARVAGRSGSRHEALPVCAASA